MAIDTSQLNEDTDSPMAARVSLLEAVQLLNRIAGVITTPLVGQASTIDISSTGRVGIGMAASEVSVLGVASYMGIYRSGRTAPHLTLRGCEGTLTAPTPVLLGHPLGRVSGGGMTPSGVYKQSAFIDFYSTENFTDTANGSFISFRTTPKGGSGDGVQIAQMTDNGCLIMGVPEVNGGSTAVARATFIGGVMSSSGNEGTLYLQSSSPSALPATISGSSAGMISLIAGGLLSTSGRGAQIDLCAGGWASTAGAWGGVIGGIVLRTGLGTGLQPARAYLDAEGRLIIANGNSSISTLRGLQLMFDEANKIGRIYSSESGVANYPLSIGVGGNQLYLHPMGHVGIGLDPGTLPTNNKVTIGGEGNTYTLLNLRDTRTATGGTGGSLALSGYTDGFTGPTNFVTFHGYKENTTPADKKGAFRIYIDDGTGSPPVRFGQFSNGWAMFGSGTPSNYAHGGTNKVVEINNPDQVQNSQSHLVLSTGVTSLTNSSVGSVTFGMPNISTGNAGRIAHIGGVSSLNHTIAKPAGYLAFATKGPNDTTAIGRVYIQDTGVTDFSYSINVTHPNARILSSATSNTDTGVRFHSLGAAPSDRSWQHFYAQAASGTVTFQVYGNGDVQNINNSYAALSDARKKENIVDTGSKLADFMKLRFVNYNLIEDPNKTKQLGLISQETELIFPGLVTDNPVFVMESDEDGQPVKRDTGETVKDLKYSVLNVITAKVVQEVYAELQEEKAKNALLSKAVDDLLQRLEILEKKVP